MRSVVVVVADVLGHQASQMTLIENDDMIEQIPAAVANPALCNAILPRTSEARSFRFDAQRLDCTDHLLIEVRGSIENQVLGSGIVGECFTQLLHDPRTTWMVSNFPVQDSPPVMRYDEEAVQHSKRQRMHGEEVHRGDSFPMVA
jgi:hypothetical protein